MENLTFLEAVQLIGIAVSVELLVIGIMMRLIGFKKSFDPGEYYQDKSDSKLFFSSHLSSLSCHLKYNRRGRPDLIAISFSLPHCLTSKDMSQLMKYIPQLDDYLFVENSLDSNELVVLQKSGDIYWGDIQDKFLWFFFSRLYQEYGYELEEPNPAEFV